MTGDGRGGPLEQPWDVAVDAFGVVYVTGDATNNVLAIEPGGAITEILDASGDGAGNLVSGPRNVKADRAGNVYVACAASSNGFLVATDGSVTAIIDAAGDGAGQTLAGAWGVAVDAFDRVYLCGAGSDNAFRVSRLEDLGGGTPGVAGVPALELTGALTPASPLDLALTQAPPSALVVVFISFQSTPAPFLGGTLHTFPYDLLVLAGSDAGGALGGTVTFPGGPSGSQLWFQVGCDDPSVPLYAASLSNAVVGTVP
jgi:hypothetical protein